MLLTETTLGPAKRRKIAVIGGGISGLGAAYSLSPAHNVTLFEARNRLGGHARTIMAGRNEPFPVDTGFMVFNNRNYPNLNALFEALDVPSKPSNMSFAVSLDDGAFEYGLHQPRRLLADPFNAVRPRFWKMIRDILKFNKYGHVFKNLPDTTLADALIMMNLSNDFRDRYLCPLAGAIWSTTSEEMLKFPAQSLVRFFDNHGLMSATDNPDWFTIDGGSKVYVDKLARALTTRGCDIRTKTAVKRVTRQAHGVEIAISGHDAEIFDDVLFACHSDQALKSLADPTKDERRILGAIRYKNNRVILHDDPSQMPKRKSCWSSWVYKGSSNDQGNNSFTYWMNLLQTIPQETPVFVTLNPQREIPDAHIFDETKLAHPQFDLPALKAQSELPKIQGHNNTWYCGAYTKYGFHEDGLSSGLEVGQALQTARQFA